MVYFWSDNEYHDDVLQGVVLSACGNARSFSTGRVLAAKQVSHIAFLWQ